MHFKVLRLAIALVVLTFTNLKAQDVSLFGGDLIHFASGDPAVHFIGCCKSEPQVALVMYRGEPGLSIQALRGQGMASFAYGHLIFTHTAIFYTVFAGDSGNQIHAKISPKVERPLELPYNTVELKISHNYVKLDAKAQKVSLGIGSDSDQLVLFQFLKQIILNFDDVLSSVEKASGITSPGTQLSADAHIRDFTPEELRASVIEDEKGRKVQHKEEAAEQKAEKQAEGSDHSALFAILTGVAQGVSGQGDNPVLDEGNRQAAAIRAIGDSNAAHQQAATRQPAPVKQATPAQITNTSIENSQPNAGVSPTNERCPSATVFPDNGAACNPVQNMQACVSVVSSGWTGSPATQNFGVLTVVYANNCTHPIRLLASGADNPNTQGELTNVDAGQQYTFSDTQHSGRFFYAADDGTDCSGNNARPNCSAIGKSQ